MGHPGSSRCVETAPPAELDEIQFPCLDTLGSHENNQAFTCTVTALIRQVDCFRNPYFQFETPLISVEPDLVANSLCPVREQAYDAQARGLNRKFRLLDKALPEEPFPVRGKEPLEDEENCLSSTYRDQCWGECASKQCSERSDSSLSEAAEPGWQLGRERPGRQRCKIEFQTNRFQYGRDGNAGHVGNGRDGDSLQH